MRLFIFNRARSRWIPAVSLILLGMTVLLIFQPHLRRLAPAIPAITVIVAIAVGIAIAFRDEERVSNRPSSPGSIVRRPANAVTLGRLAAVTAGILLYTSFPGTGAILVFAGFTADFLDGMVARREGSDEEITTPRRLGPWFDAEGDALVLYLAGLTAWSRGLAPLLILVPILARFFFALPFALIPVDPGYPRWYSWYSKSAAALLQANIAILWVGSAFGFTALNVVMTGWVLRVVTVLILVSFLIESLFRARTIQSLFLPTPRSGLARSFFIYYRVPFRHRRALRLYRKFVAPGSLVFDVGAHLGNRIRSFDLLGANTVAWEPQPSCLAVLRHWYGDRNGVTIRDTAIGSGSGTLPLWIAPGHPTLCSLDETWVREMEHHPRFSGIQWNRSSSVPVETLDSAISRFGEPDFIKIDVEGFEEEVLKGLSRPVRALSFEYLPAAKNRAFSCLDAVESLAPGKYEYNLSRSESMRLRFQRWWSPADMRRILQEMSDGEESGDVYARLNG